MVEQIETYCESLRINHPDLNIVQGDIMDLNKNKGYELAKHTIEGILVTKYTP